MSERPPTLAIDPTTFGLDVRRSMPPWATGEADALEALAACLEGGLPPGRG